MSQISTLIKRLRAAPHGLSQSEISRKTGIPQPRMSQWESGKVPAGADDALKLVAFAKGIGVQIEDAAFDQALEAAMTEAAKAGLIDRRLTVRRAEDRAMRKALKVAGQGA